jgi:hypothetical protein
MNRSRRFDTVYFICNVISSAAYRDPYYNVTSAFKFNYFTANKSMTDLGILCRQVCNAQRPLPGESVTAIDVTSRGRRTSHYYVYSLHFRKFVYMPLLIIVVCNVICVPRQRLYTEGHCICSIVPIRNDYVSDVCHNDGPGSSRTAAQTTPVVNASVVSATNGLSRPVGGAGRMQSLRSSLYCSEY